MSTKSIKALAICCLFPFFLHAQGVAVKTALGKQLTSHKALVSKFIADTAFAVAPGVQETDLYYLNAKGEDMHLFMLEADLSRKDLQLQLLTPFNKPVTGRQTITAMMGYADTTSHQVVAAVNADFFNLDTGVPLGIIYKNGLAVKDTFADNSNKIQQGLTYLGVDQNKKTVIGTRQDGKQSWSKLAQAAGGGVFLVKDYQLVKQTIMAIHPRTCVGIQPNGKIFFVVVDGRKPGYSAGIDYMQLSELMTAIGVKDAINLDGGGSSEMVIKNLKTQKREVRNKPSDGVERTISNAWGIVYTGKFSK